MMVLLELIRASLRNIENVAYDATIEDEELITMIERNHLVPLVWPVIARQSDERWQAIASKMKKAYDQAVHKALIQQIEIESVLDDMERMGMDCLPLKGWQMRNYYSDPGARTMTDFDVLVKDFDEKKICSWMESVGYEAHHIAVEHHDVYHKKPYMVVELHRSLSGTGIEKEKPQIHAWLGDIWTRCIPAPGKNHIFKLREEDFYIYHLIHTYKHARMGGTGIRPLIDVYVFMQQAKERLDWNYLNQVLQELGLTRFEQVIKEIGNKCFLAEPIVLEEKDEKLLTFLVDSGAFGRMKTLTVARVLRAKEKTHTGKKLSVIWRMAFPVMRYMRRRYPILKRYPILLPFMYIIRWVRILFSERKKLGRLKEVDSQEAYDALDEIFEIGGLK